MTSHSEEAIDKVLKCSEEIQKNMPFILCIKARKEIQ